MAVDLMLRTALAPVIVTQGLRVRRQALVLPEPPGPRRGTRGNGPALRLLIVGDSSAAGVGAPSQEAGLTGQIVARLALHHRVSWHTIARTGATTNSTIACLRREEARPFDIAVTVLGVNDVTHGTPAPLWLPRQRLLMHVLRERFGVRRIYASAMPPIGQLPLLPDPLRWVLDRRGRQFDRQLARWAARRGDLTYVERDFDLDPALMAEDGYHAGPEIYRHWAERIARHIIRDGVPPLPSTRHASPGQRPRPPSVGPLAA